MVVPYSSVSGTIRIASSRISPISHLGGRAAVMIMEPAGCGHERQTVKTKPPRRRGKLDSQMSVVRIEERSDLLRIREMESRSPWRDSGCARSFRCPVGDGSASIALQGHRKSATAAPHCFRLALRLCRARSIIVRQSDKVCSDWRAAPLNW